MTIYKLGNGKDVFNSATAQGWADGSEVFGQNGVDTIIAVGNDLTLDGGNGVDSITATGNNNDLVGGLGSDKLSATGIGNTLSGGNGADTLISVSAGTLLQVGAGNTLEGGSSKDTFRLSNASDLNVTNDTNHLIDGGDQIVGVFDVISDYQRGENIDLNVKTEIDTLLGLDAAHHPLLGDGEYAGIRGDITGAGQFMVDPHGGDLLIIYDQANGVDDTSLQGAVAVAGVTSLAGVHIV
jgi:Ca2+-binding RTX toxin-like protein